MRRELRREIYRVLYEKGYRGNLKRLIDELLRINKTKYE